MTKEEKNNIKAGIEVYKKEQKTILRILRMKKGITDDEFDRIFTDTKTIINNDGTTVMYPRKPSLRFFPIDSKAFILGSFMQRGNWSKWLHLTQLMSKIGLINITTVDGCVTYNCGV